MNLESTIQIESISQKPFLTAMTDTKSFNEAQIASTSSMTRQSYALMNIYGHDWSLDSAGLQIEHRIETIINEIIHLETLEENWDGYNAISIDEKVISNAKQVLKEHLSVVPYMEISPNSHGTISFEWETEKGNAHLEIGIQNYSFYIHPRSGKDFFSDNTIDKIPVGIGQLIKENLYNISSLSKPLTIITFDGRKL